MTPIVVMGVSGSGKTTVATAVAASLGRPLAEGDSFHSAAHRAQMARGVPLTDEDRRPWLAALRDWMDAHPSGVLTCSALRRAYRDLLRPAFFVELTVPAEVLAERMSARTDHFMPASLLPSQLDLLEPLEPDEDGVTVDASRPAEAVIAKARGALERAHLR